MRTPSVCIVYPYFGFWPEWFNLFFDTLKQNTSIDFIFYTDCDFSNYSADNVKFNKTTFNQYIQKVSNSLNIDLNYTKVYKLCDLKPFYGLIHFEDFKNYDFYGFGDIDLLLGDVRSFITNKILSRYDVISTHQDIVSGHLCLMKNTRINREIGMQIGGWREKIMIDEHIGIDETLLDVIQKWKTRNDIGIITKIYRQLFGPKVYLKEQYTTPFTPIPWTDGSMNSNQPNTWYYINGEITNNRDKGKSFIYLHFMNFKSSKYRHDGTPAPWENKEKICFAKQEDMKTGIVINSDGIMPLKVSKF
jgi:hypothetical protein